MRAASNPDLPWVQVHSSLWLQIMNATKAVIGDRVHSGHMVQHAASAPTISHPSVGQLVQP